MQKKIILLIDDDCDDAEFFTAALAGLENNISMRCADGAEQALKLLSDMDPIPVLILLDAGMPRINGWECLSLIKADVRFKDIPVLMSATSSRPEGIEEAQRLGADGYMIKPSRFIDLKYLMKTICSGLGGAWQEMLRELQLTVPQYFYLFNQIR